MNLNPDVSDYIATAAPEQIELLEACGSSSMKACLNFRSNQMAHARFRQRKDYCYLRFFKSTSH
ncbi:MAG: hypothetical protein R3B47_16275 [Bacteroidia bacterium]